MEFLPPDIINEWGLASLEGNERTEAVQKIGKMIYQAVLSKSQENLVDEDKQELNKILENDYSTVKDVLIFLKSKINNFDDLVRGERENLKKEIIL